MRRDERFEVSGQVRLEVEVTSGSARIGAGDAGIVTVSIDGNDVEGTEVSSFGDVVSVRQPPRWLGRNRGQQLAIMVPIGTDVTFTTSSADLRTTGELGTLRFRSSSGDVSVERVRRLEASTASGDVHVDTCDGALVASTASGDVRAGRVVGDLHTSHASGDLDVREAGAGVEIGTASGDVTVRACLGDDIAVKSLSGNVTIGLPAGVRVHPDISTLSGRTTLPSPPKPQRHDDVPRRSVRLRLRTASGDIRIQRVG